MDPFVPEPAWPHDSMFMGSSWPGSAASLADPAGTYLGGVAAAPDQGAEFHLQNGSAKEIVSPAELHELFDVDSALMAGTLALGSVLGTPCAISLADSAPVVCSSNDSSGSEQSGLPRFLLGEQQQQPAWASTFPQISSLVGEETSQSFGFSSNDLLRESPYVADGKKYPQLGNALSSAPLQLHVGDLEIFRLITTVFSYGYARDFRLIAG